MSEATEFARLVADVYELAGALRRHGEELAGRVGQTQARWQLLSVVSDEPRTVPQAARRLGVSRQAVQRVADELTAEGHLRSVDNPQHRRSPLFELTVTGRSVLNEITTAARSWQSDVVRGLDPAVVQTARQATRTIIERIAISADDTEAEADPRRRADHAPRSDRQRRGPSRSSPPPKG